jgi:predicted acetyltransferase
VNLRLLPVTPEWKEETWAYRQAFLQTSHDIDGGGSVENCESFEDWLEKLRAYSSEETVPEGKVPATQFLSVNEENRVVGMLDLRHRLNEFLMQRGGHIGYSVHPDFRRQGIATRQLALGLEEAKKRGLTRVLITCDQDNIGSARTIQKNGGVLENEVFDPYDKTLVQRYWVEL